MAIQAARAPADSKNWLLGHTKPATPISAGAPLFKSQKLLGDRAIISDSFSNGLASKISDGGTSLDVANWTQFPGMAAYAHRDGYNVLYGDWSAKWLGDPDQKIMWFNPKDSFYVYGFGYRQWWLHLGFNNVYDRTLPDGTGGTNFPCGPTVWHQFDVEHGIDVDAL